MVIDFLMGDFKQKLLFCWVRLFFSFPFVFHLQHHITYDISKKCLSVSFNRKIYIPLGGGWILNQSYYIFHRIS